MNKAGNPCLPMFMIRILTGLIGGGLKWPCNTLFSPLVFSSELLQFVDNAVTDHRYPVNHQSPAGALTKGGLNICFRCGVQETPPHPASASPGMVVKMLF